MSDDLPLLGVYVVKIRGECGEEDTVEAAFEDEADADAYADTVNAALWAADNGDQDRKVEWAHFYPEGTLGVAFAKYNEDADEEYQVTLKPNTSGETT